MKLERSDINFPVWRKKVDSTFLRNECTPIPNWVLKIWEIETLFKNSTSKKSLESPVEILFNKKKYSGYVTKSKTPSRLVFFRLFFCRDLSDELKATYVMSYVRSIEVGLKKGNKIQKKEEDDLPFWEFIDIEFDSSKRRFIFVAHYVQPSIFPEVFRNLVQTHVMQQLESPDKIKFFKSNWLERRSISSQIEMTNVIYYLVDSKKKLIYIGEAEKMCRRFSQGHSSISDWDYYRYDVLPNDFSRKQRVELEKMLIRCFAAFIGDHKKVPSLMISEYRLVNNKVEK